MSLSIQLIRHGTTYANENGMYCGFTDLSLTKNGREGICTLAAQNIYIKTDAHFTSGMKRANETFEILFPGMSYETQPGFREYNFGEFEMFSYEDLTPLPAYQAWISDEKGLTPCPGGESVEGFNNRIRSAFADLLKKLKKENKKSATLVAHGGPISLLCREFLTGENPLSHYDYLPSHGEGFRLTLSETNPPVLEGIEQIKGMAGQSSP